MRFINANKDDIVAGRRLGVERICSVLQVAPSTYYAAHGRPASARKIRDAELAPRLLELWESNYSVYGVRKLWKAAQRSGIDIGRDQVARLMKILQIEGVRREKRVKTTKSDPRMPRHPDLVNRVFRADAPNQLWVTDLTFVPTWQGVAYVCFIIDAFSRMIVGWRCASSMKTETVLDAIEMPAGHAAGTSRRCAAIAMRAVNSRPFVTVSVLPRSGRRPRSGPLATAMTTLSLRR